MKTKQMAILSPLVSVFTSFSMAISDMIRPVQRMRETIQLIKDELALEEKRLIKMDEKIEAKKIKLSELSKKISSAEKLLGQTTEINALKQTLKEEKLKRQRLESEIRNMENKPKSHPELLSFAQNQPEMPKSRTDGMDKIKHKYPSLPNKQLERIEIERSIARELMSHNGGSFHISQILRRVEGIYSSQVKPNDRVMLLNEIKSWIERDPLCKPVSTDNNVQHYAFI